jgi:AAA family ATP:ADP antiporter
MLLWARRVFDVKAGEGLPVALSFSYIALVVCAFLLAKPIRNALFLKQYGPYALVYVYAAVPAVLAVFVPVYSRIAARFGSRVVAIGTLLFFSANVLFFWYGFHFHRFWLLPGILYVWVNCFGIIAPVQAWNLTNALFDTRQAKRLFGLIGSGASLGAITGGALARFLVGPVGGAVNLLLVLALLILMAAVLVSFVSVRRVRGRAERTRQAADATKVRDTWREIASAPYLRQIAAVVFLLTIATQWTAFQLSLVADRRFGGNADDLTEFFGIFNVTLGIFSFLVQILATGRLLRNFGVAVTLLVLPMSLAAGDALIFLFPAFWSVLLTNAFDQGLRFSVDKATHELLYLPIAVADRARVKNAIEIVLSGVADAFGAVCLGLITLGFFVLPGLGLDLRGIAALNACLLGGWIAVAWRLRGGYVRTIHESIHRHRIDSERLPPGGVDLSAAAVLTGKLGASDPTEVRYALSLIEGQQSRTWHPALRGLLTNGDPEIRRRALALLSAGGDKEIADQAALMLRDPDIGVRTEALLYLSREVGLDPLRQIEQLGDVEGFSIRAGTVAFLAAPGPAHNLEAARLMLDAMVKNHGADGERDRIEAARLLGVVPEGMFDLLGQLIEDDDPDVARQAIRTARSAAREELLPSLLVALGRSELTDDAAGALAKLGNAIVPELNEALASADVPMDTRREIPSVLLRIGTPEAEAVLVDGLLQADGTLRHRVIASLNKLRVLHPDVRVDSGVIEVLLAAEIAGHYRSYQVMGPLRARLKDDDAVLDAMRHAMEQELERIFRLMALLFPATGLHDAYVGVRSSNPIVRANALEFLDTTLKPELRQVLVPLLDSTVTTEERVALADRFVGAPLETPEQAVATMLESEDVWLRSCGIYAIGALRLPGFDSALTRFEGSNDAVLREAARSSRARLVGQRRGVQTQAPVPSDMNLGVGAG